MAYILVGNLKERLQEWLEELKDYDDEAIVELKDRESELNLVGNGDFASLSGFYLEMPLQKEAIKKEIEGGLI
ncbi:MAG: hypothetical protein PUB96_08810 [Helicobacteraceae bacterium]|nr:hypothetical protein [Helicobacteraceae bacterium]